jgi:CRISPR/Cas system-associated exonuclease Cas4 (RecB family)
LSKLVQNLKFQKVEGFDPNALAHMIEREYLNLNRTRDMQKTTFSPSGIGYGNGRCPRYWYMAFSGAEFVEINDALGIANMQNGTSAHERLQKLLDATGTVKDTEVEMRLEDPPVRGFIDVLIDWEGEEVVGEIKTTRSEAFQNRRASMKPPGYHLIQLLLYMHARGAKYGFFLYENKNTQEILVIPVTMNERLEKTLEKIMTWMREVHANYEAKTLPTRPFTKSSPECKGCPLRTECWSGPEGEVNIAALPILKV